MTTRRAEILVGDCRAVLASMEADSIDCCVTSPPYWGLRDYGVGGQIGLEASVDAWVAELVAVFEQVKRVLKPTGTLWLNLGDSYVSNPKGHSGFGSSTLTKQAEVSKRGALDAHFCRGRRGTDRDPKRGRSADGQPYRRVVRALKHKDLIGQPWMVAFALRAAGWYLRSDIIWHKPNPMPESVRDRPTKSHEYIFLLSKSERYFYDAAAIAEPVSNNTNMRVSQDVAAQIGIARANGGSRSSRPMKTVLSKHLNGPGVNPKASQPVPSGWDTSKGNGGHGAVHRSGARPRQNASYSAAVVLPVTVRNARTVWKISTQGYKDSHYATFPQDLAARCIKAGCPAGGLVLDPFVGTGTTVVEAVLLGRRGVGIELNPKYAEQALQRIDRKCGLLALGGAA